MSAAEAAFLSALILANLAAMPSLSRRQQRIERARVQGQHARHRTTYRTSGTPTLARNGMWARTHEVRS